MKARCACKHEFEAEFTAENNYSVKCPYCGATICMRPKGVSSKAYQAGRKAALEKAHPKTDAEKVAQRARSMEIGCCILWLIIGAIQTALLYTAAAGVWNIINAIIRLRSARNIQAGNPNVPAYFDGRKTWLIVLAVINVVLGGVVGVILVIADIQNRSYVLNNRAAFEQPKA